MSELDAIARILKIRKPVKRHAWTLDEDRQACRAFLGRDHVIGDDISASSFKMKVANIQAVVTGNGKGLSHISYQLLDAMKLEGIIK